MPDFIIQLFQWLSNSDVSALTTVVGLGAFLKLIVIPAIKWIATKFSLDISGTKTTLAVYLSAIVIAIIAISILQGFSIAAIYQGITVAIAAATSALGIQSTFTAILRPNKLNQ